MLDISNFVLHTVYSCARWCYCRAEQERRLRNGQFCKVKQLVVIALVFVASQLMPVSHAGAVDSVLVNCVETPGINDTKDNHRPDVFNLSNNLARRVGSADVARGKVIYLVGRVTDAHCTPLTNVNVFIWQADSRGVYAGHRGYDKKFLGSGKATTDNLGNFGFITVVPGGNSDSDPVIHFLIKHPAFPEFQTDMFFEGIGNQGLSNLSRIPSAMRRLLTARYAGKKGGIPVYEFNLTFADNTSTPYE
ncbi:dioxygenase family protein [Anaplasma phagocytophilum]|uniref:dioxygenase family protein n=1 Tax=Anaplasma phagocytophilum TaxID=948 RepID=UPI0007E1C39F|nr:protocatechuate 3,4-dioxygenase [Anaplasma phagocytophilum]SBO30276.1 Protocatechuate 3,4-dioxygenase alpha chain [Anaplasma phagocytophilum]SBO30335.1 Protocatechuate 3,4-dioxygenase alpha chain [Anaplasma phagocytophilum]SBO30712.1 Protocatechuate 3,4-dioxygenase alpha chain [Anaplasma phagocytophilum]SCV61895.1 Protocatechuate 3,4-dioxygenase alpha chain [Anaplasma phagocytophilum]